eukprot:6300875-Alexandrium_andersonii.AAC.1
MTTAGSPCCCPRPRPGSMRLKENHRPAIGVTKIELRCSRTPRSSRDLASWQRTLNTRSPGSAGRPIDGGTALRPSDGKT